MPNHKQGTPNSDCAGPSSPCVESAGLGYPPDPDSELDPWILIRAGKHRYLFGFALRHPTTGGLAWTLSTPVVHLDTHRQRASTRSGRCYALGRQTSPFALPDQEAQIALAVLVGSPGEVFPGALGAGISEHLARRWLTTCKAARHLCLQPPSLNEQAVTRFLGQHGVRYQATMDARRCE